MADRDERLSENQRRFKAANESLRELVGDRVSPTEPIPFLCECADDHCLGRVELSLGEFELLHEDDDAYVIIPGHLRVHGEVVLTRNPRFEHVSKANA